MARGHGGQRSGAGRRPGPETEWDEFDVITDKFFWVEGRIIIRNWDEAQRIRRDTIWPILREMGLTPQLADATGAPDNGGNMQVRRHWEQRRVPHDEVLAIIADHPGKTVRELARVIYHGKDDQNWTVEEQQQAERKFGVVMHRLKRSVLRRYNDDGKLIFFPLGHPEADKFAMSPSGRLMPTQTAVRPNDEIHETVKPDGTVHYTILKNAKIHKWPTKANPEG